MKICVIGSGSTYTPELIEGILSRKATLPVKEIALMDIDGEKLEIVGNLAKRMAAKAAPGIRVTLTKDLSSAVDGASFVLAQIRVGKLSARILDEKIPLKHGLIGQETTGIGGFFKALRTIPVMKDIAETIKKKSPDAFLINFSNPSGIIAEYLLNYTDVKAIGLCNIPIGITKRIKENFKLTDPEIDYVGLNHLSFITSIRENGVDYIQEALNGRVDQEIITGLMPDNFSFDYFSFIRAIPTGYLQYFYNRDKRFKELSGAELSRGEECVKIEKDLLMMYKDENLAEKPELLNKRGGHMYSEAAISLVDAIYNDKCERHIINTKNKGALDFLGYDDIAEVAAIVGKNGAEPIKVKVNGGQHVMGMVEIIKRYEKLTVEAAVEGSDAKALGALALNPLIGDYAKAVSCYKEMKEAHRRYLPQFV